LQRIVYISCNPQTLARDLAILCAGGFRVSRAALVDMFPQSGHSEAMVCLQRLGSGRQQR
jgi:23S rRNA (uracil1939-C5)-methyltransferase